MKRVQLTAMTAIATCLFACGGNDKKPAADQPQALERQIIKLGTGEPVQPGNYIKMHVKQMYNDSILHDTRNAAPQITKYDTSTLTSESMRMFAGVAEGDSLIFSLPEDSAFAANNRPPFAKGGGYLRTYVKVLHIFRSQAEVVAETGEIGY